MTRQTKNQPVHRRTGFTLIEVMVALIVSAIVLLAGRLTVELVGATLMRVDVVAREADRRANVERLLRGLLVNAEVGTDGSRPFVGDSSYTAFSTSCLAPGGWLERCHVTLSLVMQRHGDALLAQTASFERSDLDSRASIVEAQLPNAKFVYLANPGAGGQWSASWTDSSRAPNAVGIVIMQDTTIFRIRTGS